MRSALWEYARRRLSSGGVENALQEGRWMAELLERKNSSEEERKARLEAWLERRIAGEPFQYIVGSAAFYDIELAVGPGVLIPRPETELLVDRALEVLPSSGKMLDLCTGSGAIPLAVAAHRPGVECVGVELSPEALGWAEKNLAALGLENCVFREGDLFKALPTGQKYDLITANPPYVSPAEYPGLPDVVRKYEPRMALEAAEEGLALEFAIVREAPRWLKPGGWLLLEIGETQGPAMAQALKNAGFLKAGIRKDFCGRDRFAEGRLD